MNIFKKLFGSQTTSKETRQEENKNFDVLKYDGVRALRMQQFEYAAKCFVHAIELNADDLECRDYLSQAYISLGDLEHAYEQLQEISEKQSDNIAVLLRMAEVAYMMENYSTMADVCEKALLLDDKNVMAYYLYAKAYHGQGDLNNATSMLTKAIELRADFDVARLLRGNVLLENKAIEEAALDANYQLPQGDPSKMPYTICGPYLKELFDKAFIDGLHNPSVRPTALQWEEALVKTCDLVQPCQNPKCEAHWYVFDNTTKPRCPFCGTEYKGQLPILNFYYAPSHGKYISENYRLMVYDKQTLYKWHSNNLVPCNEKTNDEDKKPVGDFHFFKGQWILINRRLPDLYDATDKKPIAIGQYVPLTDGRQILLDKGQGGRLIVVQLVNN